MFKMYQCHPSGMALEMAVLVCCLVSWSVHHFGPDWNISTNTGWIDIQFWYRHSSQRMYICKALVIPWLFFLRHHEVDIVVFSEICPVTKRNSNLPISQSAYIIPVWQNCDPLGTNLSLEVSTQSGHCQAKRKIPDYINCDSNSGMYSDSFVN